MVINSHPSFSIKALLFARFLLKLYLKWHLHVIPKYGKPYINGICFEITFYWPLAKRTNCCGRPLTWVQTLSGIKSFLKKTKCAIPITGIVKIILARVTAKDLTVRIFYKFLLYIKPRHNCCPPPIKISCAWSLQKNMFFDWMAPWKSLIFIIRFSRGKACQVSGTLYMVEFGQSLPFSSTHHGFFLLISLELCWDIELIFITCVIIL